ncbi:hypothetical protein BJF83_17745 [Nocardiopsis sp. CNR-923]|nr:hypothetical protein BJF83_17745 [Nocardiopsis sp. CNR-923]
MLGADHDGDHEDARGERWEPPATTLARLRERWEHAYRIVWTGSLWMATAYSPYVAWRTEVEPTPEQLEARLYRNAHPRAPGRAGREG